MVESRFSEVTEEISAVYNCEELYDVECYFSKSGSSINSLLTGGTRLPA